MPTYNIKWEENEDHKYSSGVDRCVLYPHKGPGVAWNGVVSVEELINAESPEPIYLDGVKVYDLTPTRDYEGVIKAYSYPDEFLEYDGFEEQHAGVLFSNQPVKNTFGLCYRTLVNGGESYKLHLLYNLTATTSGGIYNTLAATPEATVFTWKLHGVPIRPYKMRPTAHLILESRKINSKDMEHVESILYGSNYSQPRQLTMNDLVGLW